MPDSLDSSLEMARAAERGGDWEKALTHYESAFSRLLSEGDAAHAADVFRWIGRVHRQRGDTELAVEYYEASLAVAEANELKQHLAQALNSLGIVEQYRGGIHSAEALYVRAWSLAEDLGEQRLAAMIEQNLGTIANIRGDFETARLCYGSALQRFRQLNDDTAAAWTLNNMAMAHVDLGEWDQAEASYDQACALADSLRDVGLLGTIEINRAELYLKRKEFARARESCDRAFETFTRAGSRLWLAEAYKYYGVVYRETGKPGLADAHFRSAVELAQAAQNRLLEAEAESEWSLLHSAENRGREALQCLNRSHQLFSALKASRELLDLDRRLDRLEEKYLRVLKAWAESIESKDRYTAGHCERVADSACIIAEAAGITGRELRWFRMGAFLHDVGKVSVPAEILNKPGKLDPHEWEQMKNHTVVGDTIVAELDFPWDIRPMVRNHHERWDGSGYPDGLKGDRIPLHARILCVADVYDALTTTRSYRPALSQAEALGIMEGDAGRIFDPDLFRLFRSLLDSEPPQRSALEDASNVTTRTPYSVASPGL